MKINHKIFFISATVFASAIQVQAQEQNQVPNLTSSKKIAPPAYALNRIPKGGKSLFYGAASFDAPLNEEVRFHLYQWPKSELSNLPADGSKPLPNSDKNFRLDIFVRQQKKRAQFHLKQAMDIDSRIFDNNFDRVRLTANYLAPRSPKVPMIDLECTVSNGFYGPYGTNIVMVFTEGWSQKPYIKPFGYHGNHFDSIYNGFGLDSRGIVQVLRYTTTSGVDARTTQYWPWNGQKFVHTETETYGADVENPRRYPVEPSDE